MSGKTIYKIMVQIPSQGIERALPYEIHSMEIAENVAEALNIILEPRYHHYTFSTEIIKDEQKKGIHYGER